MNEPELEANNPKAEIGVGSTRVVGGREHVAFKWRMYFLAESKKRTLSADERTMQYAALDAMRGSEDAYRKLINMLQYHGLEEYGN